MANPPFLNSPNLLGRVLNKIMEAQTPARFTQDFLATKLGFSSGSAKPIIPLFKRLGLLSNDGSPTDLYARFRNPSERGSAMAEAIRIGYRDLFERNDYANALPRDKLQDLIIQVTGLSKDNSIIRAIAGTFFALNDFADFDQKISNPAKEERRPDRSVPVLEDVTYHDRGPESRQSPQKEEAFSMSLGYTINLNLPESTNPDVFNAIFKALKENLLKR